MSARTLNHSYYMMSDYFLHLQMLLMINTLTNLVVATQMPSFRLEMRDYLLRLWDLQREMLPEYQRPSAMILPFVRVV